MLHEIMKINLYLAVIMLLSFTLLLFPIPLLVPVAFVKVAASEMCVCKHFKLVMGREEQWLCVSPRGEGGIRVSSLLCRVNQSLILGGSRRVTIYVPKSREIAVESNLVAIALFTTRVTGNLVVNITSSKLNTRSRSGTTRQ